MGTQQAFRPDEQLELGIVELVAAIGYLIALVVIAGLLVFGLPLLVWLLAGGT